MPKHKRMSDAELAAEALGYKAVRQQEKEYKEEGDRIRDGIVVELAARKKRVVEAGDFRITLQESQKRVSLDRARTLLRQSVFRKVSKTVIVKSQWDEAKKAGEITDSDELHCMVEEPVRPFIYVNPIKRAA